MTGKQLKNSILQWAIQGKLVPQDPNDEPASILLERIREEKARLIKEKKIKKDKNESIIYRGDDNSHYEKIPNGEVRCIDSEIPFEIPENWCWVRLGNLFSHSSGKALNGGDKGGKSYQYITTSNLYWNRFELDNLRTMNFRESELEKCTATKGDLLVCEGGDIGRAAIWNYDYDIKIQNHIHKLRAFYPLCTKFFYYIFFLYKHIGFIGGKGIGIQGLSSSALHQIILPIAPLNEQMRIVEKIDEIMPIADKYAQTQQELDNLNSEIYDLLKKSILQEAIQGRLVPQYPTDEPATKLLERIRVEKQKLVKEGKLKAKDITDSIIYKGNDNKYYEKCGIKVTCIDNEVPFTIPESWQWARLGELITTKTGLAYSKPNLEIKSNKMVRVLRGGNITNGSWQMKADDVMISSEFVKPELYLRKGYFITPAVTSWENMGKTALVRESYEDVVVGGFVLMMCPFYIDGIFEEYLNHFFQSTLFQQYCRSITNKSGQAFYNLSRNKLLQLLVPIPPVKEQQHIYHKLNDALASIMSR